MSIATEILSLRRDQSSSVSLLLNALEWEKVAEGEMRIFARRHDVMRIVDIVLANVAAHAADVFSEPPTFHRTRSADPSRRKLRRSSPGELYQRRLFAA
jgi:hypothetical protein